MRQQYHLKRIDGIMHAWDIHRMVELSKDFPVIDIPLDSIKELDEPYWFDKLPSCRAIGVHIQLCNDADLSYPIMLFSTGRVMDGMHRVVKALLMGKTTIKAVKFEEDPLPDFIGVEEDDLPY